MSTELAPFGSTPATMSSREIAELTSKQHSNVMRDIRAMIERLEADSTLNWHCETETYQDDQGKPREMYRLDKQTTLTLVSGYDAVLRFRIIQRWQDLEAQPQTQPQALDLASMTSTALRELATKIEECSALQSRVIVMQPKADFYDHVAGSEALYDRTDTARLLRTGPQRLWDALKAWRVVGVDGQPYQKYFDAGYFRLLPVLVHKGTYSVPYPQVKVTAKGLAWLKALMDSRVMHTRKALTLGGAQ